MSEIYDAFRNAARTGDLTAAAGYLADDVQLFASLTSKPFEGKEAVLPIFKMLIDVFEDLQYLGEYDNPTGKVIVTTGTVNGRKVDGIQVLTLRADGLVSEFRDFVRPYSGAVALREAAEQYLTGSTGS